MVYILMGVFNSGKTTSSINLSNALDNSLLILADTCKYENFLYNDIKGDFIKLSKNVIDELKKVDVSKYNNVIIDTFGFCRNSKLIIYYQNKIKEIFTDCKFVIVINNKRINDETYINNQNQYMMSMVDYICLTNAEFGIEELTKKYCQNHCVKFISNLEKITIF